MLYQMEVNRGNADAALERYVKIFPYQEDIVAYTRFLLSGVIKEQEKLDHFIVAASDNWKLSRITYVDKNILRVAIYEMLYSPDVPPKVAIDRSTRAGKKVRCRGFERLHQWNPRQGSQGLLREWRAEGIMRAGNRT